MASFAKVVFNYLSNVGSFSEVHYHSDNSDPIAITRHAQGLAAARAKLFGVSTSVGFIDVSFPKAGSNGLDVWSGAVSQHRVKSDALAQEDLPYNTFRIRLTSLVNGVFRRDLNLSGIPDKLIPAVPGPTDNGVWNEDFKAFMRLLIPPSLAVPSVGSWGFMALDKTGPRLGRIAIKSVVAAPPRLLITTASAHGFTPGDQIRIRGLRYNPPAGLTGLWYVESVPSSTTFNILAGLPSGATTFIVPKSGTQPSVEKPNLGFRLYTQYRPLGFGTRKRGTGRHAPRGRRHTRRIGS